MEHHNKDLNLDETKQFLLEMINTNNEKFLNDESLKNIIENYKNQEKF